jgi:hypothetical protein
MKIRCLHGYFIFEETRPAQVSDFMRFTGLELVPKGRYFTFADLEDAPEFSIKTMPIEIGLTPLPALETFSGEPWEVFEANGYVYNFQLGLLQPIQSVTQLISLQDGGNRFVSSGIILPGSITADGNRVKDYAAHFSRETKRFLYSEVSFV